MIMKTTPVLREGWITRHTTAVKTIATFMGRNWIDVGFSLYRRTTSKLLKQSAARFPQQCLVRYNDQHQPPCEDNAMNDEQNDEPAAATDPQGRLDALVSGIELCRHCGGIIEHGECIRCGKCNNCHKCLDGIYEHGWPVTATRMICCPECGNKRCSKATDHNLRCSGSNEPGQAGSVYR